MSHTPYAELQGSNLILRDRLAIDRTVLANERTVLAYLRTAVLLFGAAVTMIKFFPEATLMLVLGAFFTFLATLMLIVGWIRYTKQRSVLETLRKGKWKSGGPMVQI